MKRILRSCLLSFALAHLLAPQAQAQARQSDQLSGLFPQFVKTTLGDGPIHWNVGDRALYKISATAVAGTSEQYVREETPDGYWVHVDVKMGFLGTQQMEMLFDKTNGQIKTLLVNGKEQAPPDTSQLDLIDSHNETITVAAGDFNTVYAKRQNRTNGQVQEAWTDEKDVPMGGMVRAIANSQIGRVTQELQSLSFAQ
jgi:hypothetical protein